MSQQQHPDQLSPGEEKEFQTMMTRQERLAAIADRLRKLPIHETPVKHEWVELLGRLSRDDDTRLREMGISELQICADRALHGRRG